MPVFNQQQPLTPQLATAIRLTAACLAAEPNSDKEALLGIAAGVTLLQRRASGDAPVTEQIILAVKN